MKKQMNTSDAALNGAVDPSKLSEREWKVWKQEFDLFLRNPGEDVKEAFRKLGDQTESPA